jgi:hypothetical protein
MVTAFRADKGDCFVMKLFHFACETRLKDWLLDLNPNQNAD